MPILVFYAFLFSTLEARMGQTDKQTNRQ